MAVLALGLVGAAAGAAAGYASIGWTVGVVAGQLLFGDRAPNQTQEGPRLNDLRVQASTYGVGIPMLFGAMRVAGNLIWSGGIREFVTETTQSSGGGGKGGGGGGGDVTTRTYTYLASFQIALGRGPIGGVRRIWAEGELIYDSSGTDLNAVAAAGELGGKFTLYLGNTTQLADPTVESYQGAGNVPAYRGLANVVFADFDVTRWGRIPSLEFEVFSAGTTSAPTLVVSPPSAHGRFFGGQAYFSGGLVYIAQMGATALPATTDTRWVVTPAGDVVSSITLTNTTYVHSFTHGTAFPPGNVLGVGLAMGQSPSFWEWIRVEGSAVISSEVNVPYGISGAGNNYHGMMRIGDVVLLSGNVGANRWLNFYLWDAGLQLPQKSPFASATIACADALEAGRVALAVEGNYFYVNRQYAGTAQRGVDKYDTSGNLVDSWNWSSGTTNATAQAGFVVVEGQAFVSASSSSEGILARLFAGGVYTMVNAGHSIKTGISQVAYLTVPMPGIAWGMNNTSGLSGSALLNPQLTPTGTTLGAIVTTLCEEAGLSASDIDVTALTDTVTGYAVGRPMTARAAIEALQQAFFFDAVESDTKLKFVKRGGASAVTIGADDLGARDPGSDPEELVVVDRMDETEAPRQVVVQYFNASGGYAQGSEYDRRLVTRSTEQRFVDLPIVLTPDQAKRAASVLLYNAHLERMPLTWQTSIKYDRYEPTDVVTLDNGSTTYTTRITRKRNEGQRIRWEGVPDHAGAHAGAGSGATEQTDPTALQVPGPALIELLDIPILRDADDDAGFYAAMAGVLAGWRGGVLFSSADGVDYVQAGAVAAGTAIGTTTTTLGNFLGGNFFDEQNSVTVRLASGELASATREATLAGSNTALIGSEIVQFRTATFVSGTTWTLTGLLRGRFGTEAGMSTHTSADRFILLQTAGLLRVQSPAAVLNIAQLYKAVSYGLTVSSAAAVSFSNSGAGKKPLSPSHLRGFRDGAGDATFRWVRRTRVGGEWRDYVDASLGEDTESYEVDVMSGSTVVRTLTSSTNSVAYTAAQQTTDFGAPQAIGTISVRVYQLSALVGRGVVASATL